MRENICLVILILPDYSGAAFKGARYLAGDEQRVACAYGV
jgi:hypothetical protein